MEYLRNAVEFLAFDLPVSQTLIDLFLTAILGVFLSIPTVMLFVRYHLTRVIAITLLVLTGLATWSTSIALSGPQQAGSTILSFLLFLLMWGTLFHFIGWQYGRTKLSAWFGPHWVRCIDYIYLIGAILGLLVTILRLAQGMDMQSDVQRIVILILGIAVALRITKTTAEIKKWDV